jgi:mono/diheme cytochrome c family protein
MRRPIGFLAVVAAVCLFAGCDENLSSIAGPTPELTPTFSSIQRDIFAAADSTGRPACSGCHTNAGGRAPSGGLNLAGDGAYDQLVNVSSPRKTGAIRVVPGDPDNSYLIQKVEGQSGILGVRMPLNGPYLSDGQIRIIRRWIETGAARN